MSRQKAESGNRIPKTKDESNRALLEHTDVMIEKAIQKMNEAASNPDIIARLRYHELAELDELNRINHAILECKKKVAERLKMMNVATETIVFATGLTIDEIKKLK